MRDIPIIFSGPMVRALLDGRKTMTRRLAWRPCKQERGDVRLDTSGELHEGWFRRSPWQRVQPGDRLWVRENFRPNGDGPLSETTEPADFMFAATASEDERAIYNWRPSIHMPRWASRLTLVVTAVKTERLDQISHIDAIAEGCRSRGEFAELWDSLHGAGAYMDPPQVVALSFTVHQRNIDQMQVAA